MAVKGMAHGRATKSPELRAVKNGRSVTTIRIACDRGYKDSNDKPITDFLDFEAWGKTAETLCRYVKQGTELIIEFHMQNNNYCDSLGKMIYGNKQVVDRFEFCGTKKVSDSDLANKKSQLSEEDEFQPESSGFDYNAFLG